MARKNVLQITLSESMEEMLQVYMDTEKIDNRSQAGQNLLAIAFRVLNNSHDTGITNRQLLEEIYTALKVQGAKVNLIHGHVYDVDNRNRHKEESQNERKAVESHALKSASTFIEQ